MHESKQDIKYSAVKPTSSHDLKGVREKFRCRCGAGAGGGGDASPPLARQRSFQKACGYITTIFTSLYLKFQYSRSAGFREKGMSWHETNVAVRRVANISTTTKLICKIKLSFYFAKCGQSINGFCARKIFFLAMESCILAIDENRYSYICSGKRGSWGRS